MCTNRKKAKKNRRKRRIAANKRRRNALGKLSHKETNPHAGGWT